MTSLIETGETIERGETKTTYDTSLIELDLVMCVKPSKEMFQKRIIKQQGGEDVGFHHIICQHYLKVRSCFPKYQTMLI